ncbi:MAG: amino acid--[acyl-carrier-protein] ligase [Rubrivivax sp.]
MGVRFELQSCHEGLVEHGLIIPTGEPGVFGRSAVFEDVLERFNDLITQAGTEDRAETCVFPPVLNRRVLEKVNYLESFPHLCGSVHSFKGNALQALALAERARAGEDWGDMLGSTGVALTPAVCYPVYPGLAGTLPAQGRIISILGWAYRHEPSDEPTRMQSFRVREYIHAGTAGQVSRWRDQWLARGIALLRALQLPVIEQVAADPFFGRAGRMMANHQVSQQLKFEVVVPVISMEEPTAICSFNYHQDKFGQVFGIRTADGEVAHTACLGFGMERVVMALFVHHGWKLAHWPEAVRQQLWPKGAQA